MTSPGRIAFSVFGLDVMWYGIMIASAMTAAVGLAAFRAPSHELDRERILDLALWIVPVGAIGARLYYVSSIGSIMRSGLWKFSTFDPADWRSTEG